MNEDRPYRSHSRPACLPCRRRKSRCVVEARVSVCLMCQAHGTECSFPDAPDSGTKAKLPARKAKQLSRSGPDSTFRRPVSPGAAQQHSQQQQQQQQLPNTASTSSTSRTAGVVTATPVGLPPGTHDHIRAGNASSNTATNTAAATTITPGAGVAPAGGFLATTAAPAVPSLRSSSAQASGVVLEPGHQSLPIPLHQTEDDGNPHIVGPAVSSDSHVLSDYLSNVRNGMRAMPMIRPMLGGDSEPVMFTKVQKRPLGMATDPSMPSLQLQMIEKLVEPWKEKLVNMFMTRANPCFPVLDEDSFRNEYVTAKDRISPALLCCLFANSTCFWAHDSQLSSLRCPDRRFIWNLACQVVFAEFCNSPAISTITAVLLNVAGRPTTFMIGNGLQLGSAVSLAHSLGLNRSPLHWQTIPQSEKFLRMKIWWCLLIHDRWWSLAYGTPPRIRRDQYDVPLPTMAHFPHAANTARGKQTAAVFIALVGLTEVLELFLEHVYRVRHLPLNPSIQHLEMALDKWMDSLQGDVRKIIARGSQLSIPGASNLRLSYLSTRLLLRRIELSQDKVAGGMDQQKLNNRYMQLRRAAEDIVVLVQELDDFQLGDFWLPVAAFTFAHTATFLIRCALETEDTPLSLSRSPALEMANDLLVALRSHQQRSGWDLADICIAQHSEIIEKLRSPAPSEDHLATAFLDQQQQFMPDYSFMDDMLSFTNFDFMPS